MKIALREIRESNYWLRICAGSNFGEINMNKKLIEESSELKNILGAICSKFK
jgi:four helix bundle protein